MKSNHAGEQFLGFRRLTAELQRLDVDAASAERIAKIVAERFAFKARRRTTRHGAGRDEMFTAEAAARYAATHFQGTAAR